MLIVTFSLFQFEDYNKGVSNNFGSEKLSNIVDKLHGP